MLIIRSWEARLALHMNRNSRSKCRCRAAIQEIVSVAAFDAPLIVAVIVAVDLDVTFDVFIVKVAEVFPAAKVTVAGTAAEERLDASEIVIPPTGLAPLIVTVPDDDFPPETVDGLNEIEIKTGGVIVNVAF